MTAEAHLLQSNQTLVDMLRNIQVELARHRTMMLTIQGRLSQLELGLTGNTATVVPYDELAPEAREQYIKKPCANEGWSWQGSYQDTTGPRNDTIVNTNEFLKLPRRFSDFHFDFTDLAERLKTPPVTPELEDIPDLTPTSARAAHSDAETFGSRETRPRYSVFPPSAKHERMFELRRAYARLGIQSQKDSSSNIKPYAFPQSVSKEGRLTQMKQHHAMQNVTRRQDDIVEQVVQAGAMSQPEPPLLQSPPRSRRSPSSTDNIGDEITALPPMPPRSTNTQVDKNPYRLSKQRVRSLLAKRASLKKGSCALDS